MLNGTTQVSGWRAGGCVHNYLSKTCVVGLLREKWNSEIGVTEIGVRSNTASLVILLDLDVLELVYVATKA